MKQGFLERPWELKMEDNKKFEDNKEAFEIEKSKESEVAWERYAKSEGVSQMAKITRSEGSNLSENRLAKLGDKVFFGLWSYPNLYYEKGKELADLLVVCDKHILIFSDKNIKFDTEKKLEVAWERWHRKAILNSMDQLRGAEQRIRDFPDKIFLDTECTQKFPIAIPERSEMKVHLICVANGIEEACKQFFNNQNGIFHTLLRDGDPVAITTEKMLENLPEVNPSGSLMFNSCQEEAKELPFCTTDYDKSKTFVHVFNDNVLTFILNELDTLKDFVDYLTEKERFIRKIKQVMYTGEEDLLYNYVKNFDVERKCHAFTDRTESKIEGFDCVNFWEEDWNILRETPQFKSKKKANEISYMWDDMVRQAVDFRLDGATIRKTDSDEIYNGLHEGAIRYMALEDRLHRRHLAGAMKKAIELYPLEKHVESYSNIYARVCRSDMPQVYIFLQIEKLQSETYEQYRKRRSTLLEAYAKCLKAKLVSDCPEIEVDRIIGHAMEPPKIVHAQGDGISEDFVLLDCVNWNDELQAEYDSIRKDMNIWRFKTFPESTVMVKEYPED
jgi:hypothetical protein